MADTIDPDEGTTRPGISNRLETSVKNAKILIADDDRDHLIMLALLLRNQGYEVISAFDARHAIQLAVAQNPDVILLDVNMGEEGGYDVQEKLQTIQAMANTPVIFITGDQSNWTQFISAGLGARAVIRKPFEQKQLLSTLKNLIEASRGGSAASAA